MDLLWKIVYISILQYLYIADGYMGSVRLTQNESNAFESEIPMPNLTAARPGFNITYPRELLRMYTPILAHGYHIPRTVYESNERRFFFGHFNSINSNFTYQNKDMTLQKGEIIVGWLTFSRPYKNITIYVCKAYIAKQMQ